MLVKTMKHNQIDSVRSEVEEARQENQRLKTLLNQLTSNYAALKTQYRDTLRGLEAEKSKEEANYLKDQVEEREALVSLSLGRSVACDSRKDHGKNIYSSASQESDKGHGGLALGLECKSEAVDLKSDDANGSSHRNPITESSLRFETKAEEVEAVERLLPSKVWKAVKITGGDDDQHADEETRQQSNSLKRPRVSVRARCDTPTMNDGCQWRKYGQKIAKGNPCPRAYYRCTASPSCPVRKQVQRCPADMSVLISTYEGNHNHPLPMAATAMASATSAAASMLLSDPSFSSQSAPFDAPNFYLSPNSSSSKPVLIKQYSHFSSPNSASHPTMTLDLTTTSSLLSPSSPSSSSISFSDRFGTINPRDTIQSQNYPSTSTLNFGANSSFSRADYNNFNGFLAGHGNNMSTNQTPNLGGSSSNPTDQNNASSHIYRSFFQNTMNLTTNQISPTDTQSLPSDILAAATKAITTDPAFQSALAATLSSMMVDSGDGTSGSGSSKTVCLGAGGCNVELGQNLKFDERFGNDGAIYYSTSRQSANLVIQKPSSSTLQVSCSESASGSPGDRIKEESS